MKRIIKLYKKYEELIKYVIVGGFTTVVSLGTYYLCVKTFLNPNNALQLQLANIISFICAVIFAYFANKRFVFYYSKKNKFISFLFARLSTLIIDMLTMFILVTLFGVNDKISKLIVQVIVLVLNYLFSKFLVFSKRDKKRVIFISSTGGHLNELLQLKPLIEKYDSYLITEKTKSNKNLKDKYNNVSYLVYGTKKNLFTYFFIFSFNIIKSFILYLRIRPDVVVTTGTHTAVPMCYIAHLFGSKVIFIETFANSSTKTVAGKLVYPIADTFIVQWESMLELYPKAVYGGWIF